jgi:hypothetical protein
MEAGNHERVDEISQVREGSTKGNGNRTIIQHIETKSYAAATAEVLIILSIRQK